MANRRRRPPPGRPSSRLATGDDQRPRVDLGEWSGPREVDGKPPGALPVMLWGAGALVAAVPLVAIVTMALSQRLPGTRWSLIGVIFLLAVIEFVLIVKALQAFLNWKDPD